MIFTILIVLALVLLNACILSALVVWCVNQHRAWYHYEIEEKVFKIAFPSLVIVGVLILDYAAVVSS